ncbi:MAG: transferrin-binding protein-like solute binding protein [Haemophilus paraphrohaemolyticus]|jgi:hypothetical protein|uniref:Slam-dependent surface lipoprotein n=1 Tax=Haemophilus paraphrohaemolyticus TaxID=736 RepID=UPI001EB20D8B|nr:Slam-dependent surface lipoprotein [Haemophilus paraphrohaemolyticus]MBS6672783.1 transferrin-binding protein-like solute binding protein [Haemophilus paraphrohaemolyticus]DAU36958.1 MAG TPA: hypothetical protein [Bacteriophage sp.]
MALTTQSLAKFGLTALSAFILTACGSSGGGNNSSAPAENPAPQVQQPAKPQQSNQPAQTVKPQQPTEAQKPVQPKIEPKPEQPTEAQKPVQPKIEPKPEQPKVNTSGTGAYSFIKEIEGNVSGFEKNIPIYFLTSFNKNTIDIDGIKIEIPSDEYLNNTWASFSKKGETKDKDREVNVCCGENSDVRFGIISSVAKDIPTYMFYNGNPTQVMPTGKATYSGDAIFMGDFDGKDDNKEGYPVGKSEFTVNFGEKKLSGFLTTQDEKKITIKADIINNAFVGSATSNHFKADAKVEVQGKFFGENAKELGGIAESHDNHFGAAFGAKKQGPVLDND